jgi:hypothetical protein
MHRLTRALCAVVLGSAATPAAVWAQDLVTNGDFDSDPSFGWTALWWDTSYSSLDVDADPFSGSAYAHVGTGVSPGVFDVYGQCIPVTESGVYVLTASGYAPSAQLSGFISLGARWEVDANHADCSGPFSLSSSLYLGGAVQADQWITANTGPYLQVPAPPNPAMSIHIVFQISLPGASDFGAGNFDAVHLVHDSVFGNGFD